MSSPIVDAIPTVPDNNCGINAQQTDTGFPFEDDFDGRHSFRSQLDEIAQRHPEFAQHLHFDQFPLRGRRRRGSDERSQPPPENRRFERPFRSRFEEFGFPFGRDFEEPEFYREEVPQYEAYHRQDIPDEPPHRENVKERDEGPERDSGGDAEVKKNIQQSNTVDLGKNQEPVDDQRGQRSMSAPPENRPAQQRFVSSINIPVQNPSAGDMGAGKSSQPQVEKPMERVIPIHVEGRDEPVLPKNPNFTATQQQQQPQPERIFGRNPSHFTQFLNKGEPQMTPEDYFKQQQRNYQQKHQQNYAQQQQQQPQQEAQPSPQHQKQQPQQDNIPEEKQVPQKPSQLDQIQSIQKDVSELMNQVGNFDGKPKDKQYLYLDEMLTRNLIKLDNIETEGKENIRQARKEAIKCIESCIAILEAKAIANQAQKAEEAQPMEVEKQSQEQQETKQEDDQTTKETEKEEVEKEEQALEVSGVVRTGNVVTTEVPAVTTPMEVIAEPENVEEKKEEEKKEDANKEEVTPPTGDATDLKPEEQVEEKKEKKKTVKKKEKADKK